MFNAQDFLIIGFIGVLEVVLSVDNALVLAILASALPKAQQKRALTYGLIGAFFFRFLAIGAASYLIHLNWIKFVGGGYLVILALKNLFKKSEVEGSQHKPSSSDFWKAVLVIELTDIAFAIDSILAAVALTDKFWIILLGGFLGVIMIRFGAQMFIKILEKFPRMNQTAYLLVLIIGLKVILEGFNLHGVDFHTPGSTSFWIFWGVMALGFGYGFTGKVRRE